MKKSREQILAELRDTDPITLTEASRVVLRGIVTVSALRSEIKRGNLAAEKIGKNLFTTPAAIREMRANCRVKPSPYTISDRKIETTSSEERNLATSMAELSAATAALRGIGRRGGR
ncbi:hypothetical protein [Mesorhizobium marinum]|uniref:DNA-binding protein n=1 Tax=Mesorhizobium marinum TaxID=3228790 RepID=A0ABV3R6D3_9HYPH